MLSTPYPSIKNVAFYLNSSDYSLTHKIFYPNDNYEKSKNTLIQAMKKTADLD